MAAQKYESDSQVNKSAKLPTFGVQMNATERLTEGQREHMIAVAAYYLAEHRHFQGGDPARDWLQAQAEIDRKLKSVQN